MKATIISYTNHIGVDIGNHVPRVGDYINVFGVVEGIVSRVVWEIREAEVRGITVYLNGCEDNC